MYLFLRFLKAYVFMTEHQSCLIHLKDKQFKVLNASNIDDLSVTCGRSVVFSGTLVSSTNKTDGHDVTEMLLKVVLNTITQTLTLTQY
jgi:hypothetical protein